MYSDDKLREECGVFGIFTPGRDAAPLIFFGLYALQHRGQEAAGIVTCDGNVAHVHKGMGLVAQVFNEENLSHLRGHLGIGHTRYSTTGSSKLRNTQPYIVETLDGPLAIAHNGNLINAPQLRRELLERGVGLHSSSDSEILMHVMAGAGSSDWMTRIRILMAKAEGAYTLVVLTRSAVYGVRDPWGLRPLVLGKLDDGGYVLASESCAFATIGAETIREIQPGEVVRLDEQGYEIVQAAPPRATSFCTFEQIYFARPDSVLNDTLVHQTRQALGRQLAREASVEADIVVAVPDSGTPHAIGYAQESDIPFSEGLIKSRYIGRTFIQPTDELRKVGVAMKYNPLPDNLMGKRVVMVDDSIVRGTTSGPLVDLLRQAGAREVHMRVACPPIKHPCFMGVDMASPNELIAAQMSLDEICLHIGADSLAYISIAGMMKALNAQTVGYGYFNGATRNPANYMNHANSHPYEVPQEYYTGSGYCNACFTGRYPFEISATCIELQEKEKVTEMWGN
ncbi:amidophosphoribosyltransferase [Chloroflexi bacterium TSY]|nr:amidophosphoribosyltransferase [Chloroflexi bacterium TSY]